MIHFLYFRRSPFFLSCVYFHCDTLHFWFDYECLCLFYRGHSALVPYVSRSVHVSSALSVCKDKSLILLSCVQSVPSRWLTLGKLGVFSPGELCAQSAAEPESALCSFPGLSCLVCRWSMRKGIGWSGVSVISLVINSYKIKVKQRAARWVLTEARAWSVEYHPTCCRSCSEFGNFAIEGGQDWAKWPANPLIFNLQSTCYGKCQYQKSNLRKTKQHEIPKDRSTSLLGQLVANMTASLFKKKYQASKTQTNTGGSSEPVHY